MNRPTKTRLKQLFKYSESKGVLIRIKKVTYNADIGDHFGCKKDDYLIGNIDGSLILAHNAIWIFHNGEIKNNIDHINGMPSDNRIENLRDVSQSVNQRNKKKQSNNTTGLTGVCFDKQYNKFRARVSSKSKKVKFLGLHGNLFDAACAVFSYRKNHGYTERHGR